MKIRNILYVVIFGFYTTILGCLDHNKATENQSIKAEPVIEISDANHDLFIMLESNSDDLYINKIRDKYLGKTVRLTALVVKTGEFIPYIIMTLGDNDIKIYADLMTNYTEEYRANRELDFKGMQDKTYILEGRIYHIDYDAYYNNGNDFITGFMIDDVKIVKQIKTPMRLLR